jgi:hypothetical protein
VFTEQSAFLGDFFLVWAIEILGLEGESTNEKWIPRQVHNGVTISCQTRPFATKKIFFG